MKMFIRMVLPKHLYVPESSGGSHEKADSATVSLEQGLKVCISNKLPSDIETATLGKKVHIHMQKGTSEATVSSALYLQVREAEAQSWEEGVFPWSPVSTHRSGSSTDAHTTQLGITALQALLPWCRVDTDVYPHSATAHVVGGTTLLEEQ